MVLFNVFLVEGIERLDWVIIFCRVDLGVFFVNRVISFIKGKFYSMSLILFRIRKIFIICIVMNLFLIFWN